MTDTKMYAVQGGKRICPICPGVKLKSKSYLSTPDVVTGPAATACYWDEAGVFVQPAASRTITSSFFCSQGHKWQEQGTCY